MDQLHVATLNLRNLADRWDERLPLLLADMAALQPDLLGLQECVYPLQQDRLLGAAGAGHYRALRGWAGRPEYGNSILVREPLAASEPERVDLGRDRSAHRVEVTLPHGCEAQLRGHAPPPPRARRGRARRAGGCAARLARRGGRGWCRDRRGRLQRRSWPSRHTRG